MRREYYQNIYLKEWALVVEDSQRFQRPCLPLSHQVKICLMMTVTVSVLQLPSLEEVLKRVIDICGHLLLAGVIAVGGL
jgi:hypothetical protein